MARADVAVISDTWYHVVAVFDASADAANRQKLYVTPEGGATTTDVGQHNASSITANTDNNTLGARGTGNKFNGWLADVRYYNTALSSSNVDTLKAINPATSSTNAYPDAGNGLGAE